MQIDHAALVVENWARSSINELVETAKKLESGMPNRGSVSLNSEARDQEILAALQRCLQTLADELVAYRSEAGELDD